MFRPIRIKVKPEIATEAREYLKTHNLGNRSIENGNADQQYSGLVGELVVSDYLFDKIPDLSLKKDEFDQGIDILYKGYKIDVKTMRRICNARSNYANNFYEMQMKYDTDILIFCSHNTKSDHIEICGWIFKKELKERGTLNEKGSIQVRSDGSQFRFRQNTYMIMNDKLREFRKK